MNVTFVTHNTPLGEKEWKWWWAACPFIYVGIQIDESILGLLCEPLSQTQRIGIVSNGSGYTATKAHDSSSRVQSVRLLSRKPGRVPGHAAVIGLLACAAIAIWLTSKHWMSIWRLPRRLNHDWRHCFRKCLDFTVISQKTAPHITEKTRVSRHIHTFEFID